MGKHAQLVMGPAGCGKSTYCAAMVQHCEAVGRSVHVVNLDPAAEHFNYVPSIGKLWRVVERAVMHWRCKSTALTRGLDVRSLITVEDVMEELNLGPNGGLIWCMEYVAANMEWLEEQLGTYGDDYLLIDCPGQVELFTHVPVMLQIIQEFLRLDYTVCGVFLLDSHFMTDSAKFLSGSLLCLSAMMQLELPHVSVMTKMDLVNREIKELEQQQKAVRESAGDDGLDHAHTLEERVEKQVDSIERHLNMDTDALVSEINTGMSEKYWALSAAIGGMLDDFNMVSYLPLDITDSDSISLVLQQVDHAIQYGEDLEPQEPEDAIDLYDVPTE